jgi:TPR repeat protein
MPRNLLLIFLLITSGGAAMCHPNSEGQEAKAITGSSSYWLSIDKINRLSIEAMQGSGEAAQKMLYHYFYALNEDPKSHSWALIGAENGNADSAYYIALIDSFSNKTDQRRIYWLRIAANYGHEYAEHAKNELLRLGLPVEQKFSTLVSFPDVYEEISSEMLEQYKEGALQGNGKMALIVATYYREIVQDMVTEEYWYRIGAQNGESECQYNYSHILNKKPDILNQKRSTFWLNRAIQNGYTN